MASVACTEGVPFSLAPLLADGLRRAAIRLKAELRPRLSFLEEDERGFRVRNLIGAIDIGGAVLNVEPKTQPGDDWIRSVLALLVGSDRVDVAGERHAGLSEARPSLWEALAARYAARLDRALRREGPLLVISPERVVSSTLRGRLDAQAWAKRLPVNAHLFPADVNALHADNDFSRALCVVALGMARSSRNPATRSRLLAAAQALRPGSPEPAAAAPGVERRSMPPQWSVYAPAWSIAAAVLARRSLLGPQGRQNGPAIAVEAWPLLERLLERSLASAVVSTRPTRPNLSSRRQDPVRVLAPYDPARRSHVAKADGVILDGDVVIGTFEAKYRDFDMADGPLPGEIYQALSTARAASSPVAVLAYPNAFSTVWWQVNGAGPHPIRLAAVGLDMFAYRTGDEMRLGQDLLALCS